jgi:hypothetical protein
MKQGLGELIATPQSALSPSGLLLIMKYFYYVGTQVFTK